jgi:hypothetical protein
LGSEDFIASAHALLDFDSDFPAGGHFLDRFMLDLHRSDFLLEIGMPTQEVHHISHLQSLCAAQHTDVDLPIEVDDLTYSFAVTHWGLLSPYASEIAYNARIISSSSIVHAGIKPELKTVQGKSIPCTPTLCRDRWECAWQTLEVVQPPA